MAVSATVGTTWMNLLRKHMHPRTLLITIDGSIYSSWNAAEKTWISAQYRAIVTVAVTYVRDCRCDRVFLGRAALFPPGTISAIKIDQAAILYLPKKLGNLLPPAPPNNTITRTGNDTNGVKLEKSSKILRPPNAFILYRKAHHESVKAAHPGIHNNQISIILGTQWQREDAAVRAEYRAEALQLKKEHMVKHPGYQYQPRKSSELKRRMTKKKAATVGESEDIVMSRLGLGNSPLDHDFSHVPGFWSKLVGLNGHRVSAFDHRLKEKEVIEFAEAHNTKQKLLQRVDDYEVPEISVGDNQWYLSVPDEYDVPWAFIDASYPEPELDDKYNPWI